MIIEPFGDPTRNGFRVRDRMPSASRRSPHRMRTAAANPILNDVVCNGSRATFSVTTLGGADRVTLRGDQPGASVCLAQGARRPS